MGTVLQIVIKTLRSRFGHFTSNDKPRFAVKLTVSRYPSAHIWDLRFAGGNVARGCHVCLHSSTYNYFS